MTRRSARLQSRPHQVERIHRRGAHAARYAPEGQERQYTGLVVAYRACICELQGFESGHVDCGIWEDSDETDLRGEMYKLDVSSCVGWAEMDVVAAGLDISPLGHDNTPSYRP